MVKRMEIDEVRRGYVEKVFGGLEVVVDWLSPCENGSLKIQGKGVWKGEQIEYTFVEQYINGKLTVVDIRNDGKEKEKIRLDMRDEGIIGSVERRVASNFGELVQEIFYDGNGTKNLETIRRRSGEVLEDVVIRYDEHGGNTHYLLEKSDSGERNSYCEYEKDEAGQCVYFLQAKERQDKVQVETRFYDKESREELSEEDFVQRYPEYDFSRFHLLWDDDIQCSQSVQEDELAFLMQKYQTSEEQVQKAMNLLEEYRKQVESVNTFMMGENNEQEEQRG